MIAGQVPDYSIAAILVAATGFEVSEFGELAHVALGSSCRETKFRNDLVRSDFLFVDHKDKNIDHFLHQRWL